MSRNHPTEAPSLLRIALAAAIWGSIPVLVRAVHASSFVVVFWRVTFAATTLGLFLAARGRLREVAALPRRRVAALAGMGALLAVNWVLFFSALQLTKVAVAVLLGYLGPVFVALLSPVFSRESLDRRIVLPLGVAFVGTVLVVNPTDLTIGTSREVLGAGLALLSAVTYALLVLNAKRLVQGIPATVYMLVEYSTVALLLSPFALVMDAPAAPVEWAALLVLGVVNTALTGFLFLSALREARPDHAAMMTYAEPVSAVLFAAAFLGEPVRILTVIGGVAIAAAGVSVARSLALPGIEGAPLLRDEDPAASAHEPRDNR